MQCAICHKSLDLLEPNKVSITMEPDNGNHYLRKVFTVCEKCAYSFLEQFYKADPVCAKCDADEKPELFGQPKKEMSVLFKGVEGAETD